MAATPAEVHFGRTAELSLLEKIDGLNGGYESPAGSITDLDEHQAIGIQHDEVDLAETAAIIALYSAQASLFEVPQRERFRAVP